MGDMTIPEKLCVDCALLGGHDRKDVYCAKYWEGQPGSEPTA